MNRKQYKAKIFCSSIINKNKNNKKKIFHLHRSIYTFIYAFYRNIHLKKRKIMKITEITEIVILDHPKIDIEVEAEVQIKLAIQK